MLSYILHNSTPYNNWRLGVDKLNKGEYIKVSKWINDIKGFFPYIKKLKKKIFRFREKDIENAARIISKFNPYNHTMISIHVRLTDYKEHLDKLYHIKNYVPTNYFRKAMDYFAEKYQVII